jgi:hypothetical protein
MVAVELWDSPVKTTIPTLKKTSAQMFTNPFVMKKRVY